MGFIDWELVGVGEVFAHAAMAWKNPLPTS